MTWELYEDKTINVKAGDVITVTDPCYDKGSGQTDIGCTEGEYECYYDEVDEGCWGVRVSRIAIVKRGMEHKLYAERYRTHNVGSAPVDAGLCGFFINKPDYDDEAWKKFCDKLDDETNAYHTEEGFFTTSGYGDGEYDISILDDNDGIIGVMVTFIEEEDDEEDDWEDEEDEEEDEDEE